AGHHVTAVVRDPTKLPTTARPATVIVGDILENPSILVTATTSKDTVISALGVGQSLKSSGLIAKGCAGDRRGDGTSEGSSPDLHLGLRRGRNLVRRAVAPTSLHQDPAPRHLRGQVSRRSPDQELEPRLDDRLPRRSHRWPEDGRISGERAAAAVGIPEHRARRRRGTAPQGSRRPGPPAAGRADCALRGRDAPTLRTPLD